MLQTDNVSVYGDPLFRQLEDYGPSSSLLQDAKQIPHETFLHDTFVKHKKFFNKPEDPSARLAKLFPNQQIYIQSLESETGKNRAVGWGRITKEQVITSRVKTPLAYMQNGLEGFYGIVETPVSQKTVTVSQLLKATMECIEMIARVEDRVEGVVLENIQEIFLKDTVQAGGAYFLVVPTIVYRTNKYVLYTVNIVVAGEVVATIKEVQVRFLFDSPPNTLLENKIIEGSVQSLCALLCRSLKTNVFPFVSEIEKVNFPTGFVKAGADLEYRIFGERNDAIITGNVMVYAYDSLIASVVGIKLAIT